MKLVFQKSIEENLASELVHVLRPEKKNESYILLCFLTDG